MTITSPRLNWSPKDPRDSIDYWINWATTGVLAPGETITTSVVTPEAGLTLDASDIDTGGAMVHFQVSGGVEGGGTGETANGSPAYTVDNDITTSAGRHYHIQKTLEVRKRTT